MTDWDSQSSCRTPIRHPEEPQAPTVMPDPDPASRKTTGTHRHAGLDPASRRIKEREKPWIPDYKRRG